MDNNVYYGVASTPMDSYLAHYGVRGMKWGVRKAIEKGDTKKLQREYTKAEKKLAKLTAKADVDVQANRAKKFNKIAKISGKIGIAGAGIATAGTGTNHTLHYINSLHKKITQSKLDEIHRKFSEDGDEALKWYLHNNSQLNSGKISKKEWAKNNEVIDEFFNETVSKYDSDYNKTIEDFNKGKNKRKTAADIGKYIGYVGAGVGGIGLGTAAVAKGKAMAAKYRTTAKGHAKAVAKRDAWKREMNKAFKGTQYDASRGSITKRRKKNG